MRAAYVPDQGQVEVGSFEDPVPTRDGQVVVRMSWASICGSDVHNVFHGFLKPAGVNKPGYPGHEGVGVVVQSRSPRFSPGDAVLTVPVLGGCFAEYQLIEDSYLVPLPSDGDLRRLLMAQQYGTTLFAIRLFWPSGDPGTVAIIGAGSAGLFFVQLAQQLGFHTIVVSDLNPHRLAVARSLGAHVIVHAPAESLIDAVRDHTGGTGADLVIEASGYDQLRADAVDAVRPHGTVGYFGFPERLGLAPFPVYAAYRKVAKLQFASATQAEPGLQAFRDAVDHVQSGLVTVDYCLGADYSLDQVPEALQLAKDPLRRAVKLSIDLGQV